MFLATMPAQILMLSFLFFLDPLLSQKREMANYRWHLSQITCSQSLARYSSPSKRWGPCRSSSPFQKAVQALRRMMSLPSSQSWMLQRSKLTSKLGMGRIVRPKPMTSCPCRIRERPGRCPNGRRPPQPQLLYNTSHIKMNHCSYAQAVLRIIEIQKAKEGPHREPDNSEELSVSITQCGKRAIYQRRDTLIKYVIAGRSLSTKPSFFLGSETRTYVKPSFSSWDLNLFATA